MRKDYSNPAAAAQSTAWLEHPENFPFSFRYNGKLYQGFSGDLTPVSFDSSSESDKNISTKVWKTEDGILVKLITAFYPAYGAFEWTVWFENDTDRNSGILSELKSTLTFAGERPVLRGILGDHVNNYQPYAYELSELPVHFLSDSGRPTHVNFPYFNLEYGNGGAMLVIGWAGTWSADFSYDGSVTTYEASSTVDLHSFLKPGEKIRTALFVLAPYAVRSENYATNYWRSWFVNCNLPANDASGEKAKPFSACCLAGDTGLHNTDGSISERYFTWKPSLEKMIAEDCKVDFRWFDAGWYVAPDGRSPDGSTPDNDWWTTVGTWELDPVKWPGKTFLESTDYAREHGMRTLMWFEPERVTDPESLVKNYGYKPEWAIRRENCGAISNNIGIPECLEWTTERVCKVLRENKVEMYREDNNSDPGSLWRYLDSLEGEDRKGITECKFINGHYKMWDDIIACTLSFGGCGFVDSCASGGGRNDLESLRRGIPLLRSDADRTSTSLRLSMTTGFNRWIPFCGANTKEKLGQLDATGRTDVYTWRASYLPSLNVDSQFAQDPDQDFSILRNGLKEWKKLNKYLLEEFYVLTPWHSEADKTAYTAYSFWSPEEEKGVLLAFRMEECPEDKAAFRLPYVEKNALYLLTDEDSGEKREISGEELLARGAEYFFENPRTARLIWVEKK